MSTYLYLQCHAHTPPLEADDESGQHLYDLPRIRQELLDRKKLVTEMDTVHEWRSTENSGLYFRRNSAKFLCQHLNCDVRIFTEYGEDVTNPDEGD